MELFIPTKEISYTSGNENPYKTSCIFSKKAVLTFVETEPPPKNLCISGGISKGPKTKIYYIFPKTVMNKFFKKHFQIIVSIIYIN